MKPLTDREMDSGLFAIPSDASDVLDWLAESSEIQPQCVPADPAVVMP